MAKLKDRKLYKKGILKLQGGGMVPQSPFTAQGLKQSIGSTFKNLPYTSADLKQTGISALNTIKNPTTYTQFAKKLPMRTLGVMGLTNPYTLPFAGPMVAYSIADTLTPQSVKDRAELKRQVDGEYEGIQDYMEVPERESTVDLLKRAQNMNIQTPLTKRLSKDYNIKVDDRETGAEVIDKGGSDMQVKKPTDISNRDPEDNNQLAQQLVNDQKKIVKNAEKVFNDMESKARGQGKMTNLNSAIEAAREVMGEQGYGKSGRLLLLQLASNLLAGKTMQPGVQGFLDVLGQAGQNVIPMAIALEREREKDELDLAKLLLESGKKTGKIRPPSLKIKFRTPNGEISDPVAASETDDGNYLVYDNIPGEGSIRYIVSPDQVVGRATIMDDKTTKGKLLQQYKTYKAGQMYTQTFLDIASKDPSLIGGSGGFKDLLYTFYEAQREATGGKDYRDTILKLTNEQRNLIGSDSDLEPEAREELNSIFSEVEKMTQNIDNVSEDIQKQSLLKTLQLLSTYSLAQTLKDKDRLAVQDIKNAEQRLSNIMRLNPFEFRGDIDILSSYKAVNEQFDARLQDVRTQWDNYLFNPDELISIDKNYGASRSSKEQKNLDSFINNFDASNNQDMEMFNKMFNENNLKGIISQ